MAIRFFFVMLFASLVFIVTESFSNINPDITFLEYAGKAGFIATLVAWVAFDFADIKKSFAQKGAKYGMSTGVVFVLGVMIIVGLSILATKPRFNKTWDVTKTNQNTLSSQTTKLLSDMREKDQVVEVIAFFESDEIKDTFRNLIRLYQSLHPQQKVEYIDPIINRTVADAEGITSGNTVVFKYGEEVQMVTTFNEEKITSAIANVLRPRSRTICFSKGHGESDLESEEAKGFQFTVSELKKNKFEVESLSLLENGEIPDKCEMFVIAGATYEWKPAEIRIVDAFIRSGKPVLAMLDAASPSDQLNSLFSPFGLSFNYDYIVLKENDPRVQLLGRNIALVSELDDIHPITREFAAEGGVVFPLANSRSLSLIDDNKYKMKIDKIATAASVMLRVKDIKNKDDLKGIGPDRFETGEFLVAAVSEGEVPMLNDSGEDSEQKNQVRIALVGSAQLASNYGAQQKQNVDLFFNIANYLMRDEGSISIRPKDVLKTSVELTSSSSQTALNFVTWVYPFLFLISGLVFWARRRRA